MGTPEDEIDARSARREHYGPGEAPTNEAPLEPLEIVSAASLAGLPTPRRWFLDAAGLFPLRNVTILAGDGGTGKSLLSVQLSAATSTGGRWLGIAMKKGPVLHISAEDDLNENHIRLTEICAADGLDLAAMTDLHICSLAGKDAVLAQENAKGGGLAFTPLFKRLRAEVKRLNPILVVIDNLADAFSGNENTRHLVRQFISALRGPAIEFNCAVLLLAHPSLSGVSSGTGTSGSTAWNNSVRSRLYLVRDVGEDGIEMDANCRTLRTMKANYGPTGGQLRLRWEAGRFTRTDIELGGAIGTIARAQRAERVFMRLLEWHNGKNKPVSSSKSSAFAPAIFARHPQSEGIKSREFENAMNVLLDQDKISIVEEGSPSRLRRRLVIANPAPVE